MPSRPVAVLIVLGWLAALGWFCDRELWPVFFPSQAPPFVIDLGDEVTSQLGGERRKPTDPLTSHDPRDRRRPDVLWGIYRGADRIGRAETRLRYYDDDNTFELETRVVDLKLKSLQGLVTVEVPELFNAYRVSRRGEFLGMRVAGNMKLRIASFDAPGSMNLTGRIEDGKVIWSGEIDVPGVGKITPMFEPIDAPKGSILNPLQPLPKIKYVRPGRRWRMPIIDPLADAVEPAIKATLEKYVPGQNLDVKKLLGARPTHLDAEVLNETAKIILNGIPFECRIIEFRGEGSVARTYVRMTDGAVMRQEATTRGESIVLQRE
jgi:hypothetical protein